MKHFLYIFLMILPVTIFAQITIVSTYPQNNATNVPLNIVLATTFSTAVDTTQFKNNKNAFANVDSSGTTYFSADAKTVYTPVYLKANKVYFVALIYVKGKDGSKLLSPYVAYFTTAVSFPTLTVSGTVVSGNTGVSPQNAIVGLSTLPIGNSEPNFVAWANVNNDGTYSLPYVVDGKYWPIAAKDVNGDGNIDPSNGLDVIAFGDSIVVTGTSITNLILTFKTMKNYSFTDAIPIADSLAKNLSTDRLLKSIRGSRVDSTGKAENWSFYYTVNSNTIANEIRVSSFNSKTQLVTDEGYSNNLKSIHTLTNPQLAAASSVVIGNTEGEGGKTFRQQSHSDSLMFKMDMTLGDLSWSEYWMFNPDPNLLYWGVTYSYGVEKPQQWITYKEKKFLCSFSTGVILKTTSVKKELEQFPSSPVLMQNYPNPFNPVTVINYQLPLTSYVTIKVYDLLGREAATLVNEEKAAGRYSVQLAISNYQLPSGIYFYRMQAGNFVQTRNMIVVK